MQLWESENPLWCLQYYDQPGRHHCLLFIAVREIPWNISYNEIVVQHKTNILKNAHRSYGVCDEEIYQGIEINLLVPQM